MGFIGEQLMPHPLKKRLSLKPNAFGLQKRPALAVHIAVISSLWTEIEYEFGYLLAVMMGADADVGIHMFQAIKSEAPQRSVIAALGERYLFREDRAKLDTIMEEMRKRAKERNLVVHAVWATDDSHPDALIRLDDKRLIKEAAAFQTDSLRPKAQHNALLAYALRFEGPEGMLYQEKDLTDIEGRLLALQVSIMSFADELQKQRTKGLRRKLIKE